MANYRVMAGEQGGMDAEKAEFSHLIKLDENRFIVHFVDKKRGSSLSAGPETVEDDIDQPVHGLLDIQIN